MKIARKTFQRSFALTLVIGGASITAMVAAACSDDDSASSGANDAGGSDSTTDANVSSADAGITLSIALHRVVDSGAPNPIHAVVRAAGANDAGLAGLSVQLTAGDASVSLSDDGDGDYEATTTPPFPRGELPFVASAAGATTNVTALVLDTVGDEWDQPESVGGYVNTAGTEDSATLSPDGEWMILGDYLPVDALCCFRASAGAPCNDGPADGRNSACTDLLGPTTAPSRPNLPGTDRIVGDRITQADPQLCATSPDGGDDTLPLPDGGILVPPIPINTAYSFHRQADGTFREPFLVHFDDDGFSAGPFCFTFLSVPAGGSADVLFAFKREDDFAGPHHPARTTLMLGQENLLGTYACDGGVVDFRVGAVTALPVSPLAQNAGNTSEGAGYLWSDDENQNPAEPLVAQMYADGGIAPWSELALPNPGDDRRQPVLRNGRLYYYRQAIVSSATWDGGPPDQASSFGPAVDELAGLPLGSPTASTGDVVALGQPTFASRPDGSTEMMFVYYKKTTTGFDGQIGIVKSRAR